MIIKIILLLLSSQAFALQQYSASDLSKVTSTQVTGLLETIGYGSAHRPYRPASRLGTEFGFEFGADLSLLYFPNLFTQALKETTSVSNIPAVLPLPRLHVAKGLPWGLDVGASYIGYQSNLILGAHIQWNIQKGNVVRPDLALRYSQTWTKLFFIRSKVYQLDFLISRPVFIFEPFLGVGLQVLHGELAVPIAVPQGLPINIHSVIDSTAFHFMAGIPVSILIGSVTPMIDYNFNGIMAYGLKVAFKF